MLEDNDDCMFDELEPLEVYGDDEEVELVNLEIGISDSVEIEGN